MPSIAGVRFPVIVRGDQIENGNPVRHVFRYSAASQPLAAPADGAVGCRNRRGDGSALRVGWRAVVWARAGR
jgi:beta-galactosidase